MERGKLLVAAALAVMCAHARADDEGEWQFSALLGQGRLQLDGDRLLSGESESHDTTAIGTAVGYRLPAGALLEVGYILAEHADFGANEDFISKQFSASFGWQFEKRGWRFKPRIGFTEYRLYNDARLLLDEDGERHFWQSSVAPFGELSLSHRIGRHFAMGATYRETFAAFGHHRTYGLLMTLNF